MRIVIALGGNALLQRGEPLSADAQQRNARAAAAAIATVAREHEVVVTHGNGPQVGLLANQAECDRMAWPLDVVGAESHGMIGYILARELHNALGHDRV
ncbi:MAG: carbamate kinase, partial [Thioalkalivibrio sp.]|nr:carbamate kinase [Thioalkalivibrio sp.]